MSYTLSVVQLCPDAYKDIANSVAEARGYGEGNLSVKLIKESDNSVWWGCHAWWIPSVFEQQMVVSEEVPQYIADALSAVISSSREGGSAQQHWMDVLSEYGMIVAIED